jgi:hypothetical protein
MSGKGRDYILFLEDILAAIEKIEVYTRNMTYDEFRNDGMMVDAVIRNLEIIGEATKNIPKRIWTKYPELAWFPSGNGLFPPWRCQSAGLLVRRTDVRLRATP